MPHPSGDERSWQLVALREWARAPIFGRSARTPPAIGGNFRLGLRASLPLGLRRRGCAGRASDKRPKRKQARRERIVALVGEHGESGPAAVTLETLLAGYRRAYERWMAGPRIEVDQDAAFFAIFELLNWAVVIDTRLQRVSAHRDRWASRYPEGGYVLGFRYARNAVHHDWADALYISEGGVYLPTPVPFSLFEWCWRRELPSTKAHGRAKYRDRLAGKPVRFTLEALGSLYRKAVLPGVR
jgi:hypothetical protein